MPSQTKATRSHRFILSATGIAFIVLVMAIASPGASANISGSNRPRDIPLKQTSHTTAHALFLTGDVDFDYAANMRMHHQLAIEMSQAQIRNGKNPKLRNLANKIIAEHRKEIAVLDQWMASRTRPLSQRLLSSK
jgi:hypothetical protein